MTETQIAYVEHSKTIIKNFGRSESMWMKKSIEDWENLEAMTKKNEEITKENEDLKNRLNQLQKDFEWSQKRNESKNRRIERLKKGEDRNQEFRTDY